jgi:hypothetical protein
MSTSFRSRIWATAHATSDATLESSIRYTNLEVTASLSEGRSRKLIVLDKNDCLSDVRRPNNSGNSATGYLLFKAPSSHLPWYRLFKVLSKAPFYSLLIEIFALFNPRAIAQLMVLTAFSLHKTCFSIHSSFSSPPTSPSAPFYLAQMSHPNPFPSK